MDLAYLNKIFGRHFSAIAVFVGSVAILLYFKQPTHLLRLGVLVGLGQTLAVVGLRHFALRHGETLSGWRQLLHVFFAPRPHLSIGGLVIGVASYTLLLVQYLQGPVLPLFQQAITLSAGFLSASSLISLLAGWLLEGLYEPSVNYRLEDEYVEIFLAAMVASAFLGITYANLPVFQAQAWSYSLVLLPFLLGLASLLINFGMAFILEHPRVKQLANPHLVSFAAMMLLLVAMRLLLDSLLPAEWVKHGHTYQAFHLRYILLSAVFGGFLAGRLASLYQYFAKNFVDFLLETRLPLYVSVPVRLGINLGLAYLPMLIAGLAITFGYLYGDLYGAFLALLGLVSNAGATRLVVANWLLPGQWLDLSQGARRKLNLLMPSLAELWARWRAPRPVNRQAQPVAH
ncbi:MAG: hypothetical protein MUC97_08265 [Bernardetiaceae bacterium]|jgi:hypothetical protein|nr:hypothetical protein [Bernardetiaceae bacterium]